MILRRIASRISDDLWRYWRLFTVVGRVALLLEVRLWLLSNLRLFQLMMLFLHRFVLSLLERLHFQVLRWGRLLRLARLTWLTGLVLACGIEFVLAAFATLNGFALNRIEVDLHVILRLFAEQDPLHDLQVLYEVLVVFRLEPHFEDTQHQRI